MRRRAADITAEHERDLGALVDRIVFDLDVERAMHQRRIEEIDSILYNVITTWAR